MCGRQLLGFNCLRIPFSFQNLMELQPTNFTKKCANVTDEEVRISVTPPDLNIPASRPLPPQVPCIYLSYASANSTSMCLEVSCIQMRNPLEVMHSQLPAASLCLPSQALTSRAHAAA